MPLSEGAPVAEGPLPGAIPDFGALAGVRVVHSGQALAGPFAAQVMADFGADVLWLENPLAPDLTRSGLGLTFQMERRNQSTLALNIPTPRGTDILLRLLRDADIFIESSKGGQFQRWGLDDDTLWGANPALVIVHTSGYGQSGDPNYVSRAAFDPIAQAYGCYLQHNGPPDGPPIPASPFPGDYMAGLFGAVAALAALHRSRQTGVGDSIDVAMFEVMMRAGGTGPMAYLNAGQQPARVDMKQAHGAGCGVYRCGDGNDVYLIIRGAGVLKRVLPLVGLEPGSELFPVGQNVVPLDTQAGQVFERALTEFCSVRAAQEVDQLLNAHGVPCSVIYTYDLAEQDPHYRARDVFTSWLTAQGEPIHGVNVVPKFKKRPGRVWRGSPVLGMDSVATLRSIGLTDTEIDELCDASIVAKANEHADAAAVGPGTASARKGHERVK